MRLFQAIEDREPWAIAMVVKTLGKDRGYVERTEQALSGHVGSNVRILLPAKVDPPKALIAHPEPIKDLSDEQVH